MEGFLEALKSTLKEESEEGIDLFQSHPGFKEFSEAAEEEYETRNFAKAKELYEKACEFNHPMALVNYALWYLEGNRPNVHTDLKKAFQLFQKAAEHNVGMAEYNLAEFYRTGKGGIVDRDPEKAYQLLKSAVEDKRVTQMRQAQPFVMLGWIYMEGEGCIRNYKKAQKCFQKAEEFGCRQFSDHEFKNCMNILRQIDPWAHQKESDLRWDRMAAYQDQHPDEKQVTYGDWEILLKKFGFGLKQPLSEQKKNQKCSGFDKFMEATGGGFDLLSDYEMKNAPKIRRCGNCGSVEAKKLCKKCGQAYCNRECQIKDWPDHKPICLAVRSSNN